MRAVGFALMTAAVPFVSGCGESPGSAPPSPPPAVEAQAQAVRSPLPAEFDFTGGDGTRLHAHAHGAPGEVVVLLHGGPGFASSYMDGLLETLSGERRAVVRYDQRGVGGSDRPANGRYDVPEQVADLEALRVR